MKPNGFTLPSLSKIKTFLILMVLLGLEFTVIYGGGNYLAHQRESRFHIYFEFERNIPFIPMFIYIYLSLNAMTLLSLFFLNQKELIRYACSLAGAIFVAGIFFVLLPTEAAFVRKTVVEGYEIFFSNLYFLDKPHNLFPSLHITICTLTVLVVEPHAHHLFKKLLWLWLALVFLAVLFVHQHHIPDILSGIILGLLSYKFIYKNKRLLK